MPRVGPKKPTTTQPQQMELYGLGTLSQMREDANYVAAALSDVAASNDATTQQIESMVASVDSLRHSVDQLKDVLESALEEWKESRHAD